MIGGVIIKNINIIRKLSSQEIAILLVRQHEEVFSSPSGEEFSDYGEAVEDCAKWLNTNCEQTVNNSKNGKNFDL